MSLGAATRSALLGPARPASDPPGFFLSLSPVFAYKGAEHSVLIWNISISGCLHAPVSLHLQVLQGNARGHRGV